MTRREPEATRAPRGLDARSHGVHEAGGTPMRVLVLDPRGGSLARCAGADGISTTVETVLVSPLEPGAIVLVQAGVALARLDAEWVP